MRKIIILSLTVGLLGQTLLSAWPENRFALALAQQLRATQLLGVFPSDKVSTCATLTPFSLEATRLPSTPTTPRLKTLNAFYSGNYPETIRNANFDNSLAPFLKLSAQALQNQCVDLVAHYKNFPFAAELFNTLGEIHLTQNHITAARAYYEVAWQLDPTNPNNLESLILIAMRTRDTHSETEFLESYLALPNIEKNEQWYLQQGRLYELRGQWRAALQIYLTQSPSAEGHYRAGEAYKALSDLPNAQKELETAINQDPQLLAAWGSLNFVLLNQKKYNEAHSLLQQMRQALPASEAPDLYEGWNALLLNQPHLALTPLQKATTRNPQNALAWELLGQAYLQTKQPALAAQAFEYDVQVNPFSSQALAYWGYALLETGQTALGCTKVKEAKALGTNEVLKEIEQKWGGCP